MVYLRPGFIVVIVGCTLTAVSTLVVGFRYFCRWYRMGQVAATDHLIFVALLITWGNTVINYYQDEASSRFRPSQFRNPAKRPKLEVALRGTLVTWYVYRITYGVGLCFVKLSILAFYRSIATNRTFRRVVNGTILFVILYTLSTTLASAFQCTNPAKSYDTSSYLAQFDKSRKSSLQNVKCFDPSKLWLFTGAVNLFTDVLILGMPIPTLLSLRVPMSKRLALIGIFSVGIMAIVASCVRMWVVALWAESPQNSARFGTDLLLWGQVETNAGIVSASVPFLRLAYRNKEKSSEYDSGGRGKFGRMQVREMIQSPVPNPDPNEGENGEKEQPLKGGIRKKVDIHTESLDGGEKGLRDNPAWAEFITVPRELESRGSRRSGGLGEAAQVYVTV